MPRKSAAAYLIPAPGDGRPTRLRPPADIPPSVAGVMAEIIGSVDAAHLRACDLPMVEELARTIVTQRATAHALIGAPLVVSGKPNPLLVMERAATKLIAMLATRLRLTPQSRLSKDKANTTTQGGGPGAPKPWDE